MTIALTVAAGMLVVAALLCTYRIARGPRSLDRVVAADVLVVIIVAGLGIEAAISRHTSTLAVLVVVSMVGFVGAVSIARFIARQESESAQ